MNSSDYGTNLKMISRPGRKTTYEYICFQNKRNEDPERFTKAALAEIQVPSDVIEKKLKAESLGLHDDIIGEFLCNDI